MKKILLITRRDFQNYFSTPLGSILLATFAAINGIVFYLILKSYLVNIQRYSPYGPQFQLYDINTLVVQPFFHNVSTVLLFIIPLITMRAISEERRNNTIELLLTAPISSTKLAIGKFLASLFFIILLLAVTTPYPAIVLLYGEPDFWPIVGGYFGLFLNALLLSSIGLLVSSLTRAQISAAAITFGIFLCLILLEYFTPNMMSPLREIVTTISLQGHLSRILRGSVALSDVLYFISGTVIFLSLVSVAIESIRWKP